MGFVVCPLADSYIHTAAQDAGAVAAARKTDKYAALESHYIFQPIAVETLSFPAVERVDSTLQRSSSS